MRLTRTALVFLIISSACTSTPATTTTTTLPPDRASAIPADRIKVNPSDDAHPPLSETSEYINPVPLPPPINTAGAEDSAFVTPDGNELFIFFTPDVDVPVAEQASDGITGIWHSRRSGDDWTEPKRVLLQDPGKAGLDGCEFVLRDTMWFCTAREGYTGIHWFAAVLVDGTWTNWQESDFDPEYEVGELHISSDGSELFFHSSRAGGIGDLDIWVSHREGNRWGTPENVAAINSTLADGWPSLSPDGTELWFTRSEGAPVLYRSVRSNDGWAEPVRMFSGFAGESSIDTAGNVYFTHHFFLDDEMIEADIYVAVPTGVGG